MDRRGSGFKKILRDYQKQSQYTDDMEPEFNSDNDSFLLVLKNLNYAWEVAIDFTKVAIGDEKVAIGGEKVAIDVLVERIDEMQIQERTKKRMKSILSKMYVDKIFGRTEIADILDMSVTSAGNMITKMKEANLIEEVQGFGKGKYRFKNELK